jgi:large subunit ribosomal protein L5
MNRLRDKFEKDLVSKLAKEFDIKNKLAVPRVKKVVVNMGIGDAAKNKDLFKQLKEDMAAITGQYPSERQARVSVASFSVRRGMVVGLKTTLRSERMYAFLDKLFSIVLPRLRDFRGVSLKSFDGQGNYNLGIEDHTVFPEVDLAKSQPRGLEVTIVVNTDNKKKAHKLLELMGMPFERVKNK